MDILEKFKQQQVKDLKRPTLKAGDTVRVMSQIKEGKKTRNQVFEGTVLSLRGSGPSQMVTVRRVNSGFSVERIFPLMSPLIQKIEITRRQKTRRAKLTYLRADTKRRRVKEDFKGLGDSAEGEGAKAEETKASE